MRIGANPHKLGMQLTSCAGTHAFLPNILIRPEHASTAAPLRPGMPRRKNASATAKTANAPQAPGSLMACVFPVHRVRLGTRSRSSVSAVTAVIAAKTESVQRAATPMAKAAALNALRPGNGTSRGRHASMFLLLNVPAAQRTITNSSVASKTRNVHRASTWRTAVTVRIASRIRRLP